MIIYPAIDLKDGNCVRLLKGEMEQATVFSNSPADQAKTFEKQGFKWLHLIDLNGAFEGKSVNTDAIRSILQAIDIPVQLGGGIRTIENIKYWLDLGINRVILGTIALRNPELVKEATKQFPNQIVVGIDARDGKVAVEGWAETSDMLAVDLARKFEDTGVAAIIYTDINRDGLLQGVNAEETAKLADAVDIPVIASGGVASIEDIRKLSQYPKITGAIIGRALYDDKITPDELSEYLK